MKEKPNYYSIIPANVRYDNRLTPNAKLLYAEITALVNMNGECFASNEYFARLYNVSDRAIRGWINKLIKFGYVKSTFYKDDTRVKRYLEIVEPIFQGGKNFPGGGGKNFPHNNTLTECINTISPVDGEMTNGDGGPVGHTTKHKQRELHKFGEFKNVNLTNEDFERLSKNPLFPQALEKLDSWLDNKDEKTKNKNHRWYFKKDNWVWPKEQEQEQETPPFPHAVKNENGLWTLPDEYMYAGV